MLTLIDEKLTYRENKTSDERDLVRKILAYIQENFRQDITRTSIARALGYTEAHISRVFHRCINKGLSEYINDLRLDHIDKQRRLGDTRKTTELIFEAGFKSQQTYYRAKQRRG